MDAERYSSRARSVQRIVTAACLSVLALVGCKDSPWTPMGSAELVLSEIKLGGADKVSRRIDSDENFGRSVTDGIATGDSLWLEVARQITPATAAAEATLSIALASALPRSPRQVLRLVGETYPTEQVCGIPFLRADSAAVITYYDEATRALGLVRDSTMASVRVDCQRALDEARRRRLERIDPAYIIKNKPAPVPRRRRR